MFVQLYSHSPICEFYFLVLKLIAFPHFPYPYRIPSGSLFWRLWRQCYLDFLNLDRNPYPSLLKIFYHL
eukprot:UN18409